MKGFEFRPVEGEVAFGDGVRPDLVFPDNKLFNFIPDSFNLVNYDVAYPDVTKDKIYFHHWNIQRINADVYRHYEDGFVEITALPQEYEHITVLDTAPADAEVFIAQIKLVRTVAPSHDWALSLPISKMVPENVWITNTGSFQLEGSLGFTRVLSIMIDQDPLSANFGKLVLIKQQSVGTAPGGYGDLPPISPATGAGGEPGSVSTFGWSDGTSRGGGEVVEGTTKGWPLYYPASNTTPHYRVYGPTNVDYGPGPSPFAVLCSTQGYRKSGANPPTLTDPTNMGSTWRIQLRGRYGRRT